MKLKERTQKTSDDFTYQQTSVKKKNILGIRENAFSRSSPSQMFFKIDFLKSFAIFTEKHLCWSLFLNDGNLKRKYLIKTYFQTKFPQQLFDRALNTPLNLNLLQERSKNTIYTASTTHLSETKPQKRRREISRDV